MAKSTKDKPADKGAAKDSPPEADALTPDAPETEDTLPGADNNDSLTAESTDVVEDTFRSQAEDDTVADPILETGDPADTDPVSVGDDVLDADPYEDTLVADAAAPGMDADPAMAAAAAPQVIRETVVERKGGFMPVLLGGVVAAGLGFVAGSYPDLPFMGGTEEGEDPFVTETRAALLSQGEQIETLTKLTATTDEALGKIDLAPLGTSVTALEGGLGDLRTALAALDTKLTGLSDKATALDIRLTSIEKQPLVDAVSPDTVAAYERELETLKADVAAQKAAIAAAQADQLASMEAARKEIEAMADRARASEQSAESRATLAASRAALADLTTRARDGQPYVEPLAVLTANGVDVPTPLVEGAQDGLPTASALISSFPDAARDALAVARASGASEEDAGGVAGFFRNQLGARSVTPREGNDPDAILSRAEAALRNGDLNTVLTEIEMLPEAAQNEMSDWVAMARLRRGALAAAADLTQTLNQE
ncbi:COG4223 family protein [Antarctobacter heliothermus]|uniref:COG4223 family protein n=1 Tax=Antarctobacter heliothermus TaxID=74033 RepID=UPI000B77F462|nr:hypothetical protein [Antarctobacter heliothermus]